MATGDQPILPPLTVPDIYAAPDPEGATYTYIDWSPDATLVSYLCSDNNQNKIFAYNVAAGTSSELFDFAKLPGAKTKTKFLTAKMELIPRKSGPIISNRLVMLRNIDGYGYHWAPDGKSLLLNAPDGGPLYLLDLKSGHLPQITWAPAPIYDFKFSPNGKMVTFACDYNVWGVELATLRTFPVTWGGTEAFPYGTPDSMGELLGTTGHWWSPDSSRIACLWTAESGVPQFPMQDLLLSSGPVTMERYPLAGQPLPVAGVCIYGPKGLVWVDTRAWPGWLLSTVTWLPDSRHLAMQFLNREQNRLVLLFADADTGVTVPILTDSDPSFINVCNDLRFFARSNRFLWSSEHGSYRQLYLYDQTCKATQLTSGDEASIAVMGLDEKDSAVYYLTFPPPWIDCHLKRVRFSDKSGRIEVSAAEDLTPTAGVHTTILSPGFAYFIDYCSTINQPPQILLYKTDGTRVATIAANDNNRYCKLKAAGQIPQFEFITDIKAPDISDPSDGVPLLATILKPPNFSEGNKYPVLVYVYGGPNPGGMGLIREAVNSWAPAPNIWLRLMANLGFVVFSLDNRGSNAPARGHAFETPVYRRLGYVELKDQLAGIEYLKSTYKNYIDPSKIGIFGGSYGGFLALTALLKASDAFHTAAAFAPVTDWRGYEATYAERYMGLPAENVEGYDRALLTTTQCTVGMRDDAKLLLLHGADDDNVHIVHSMQLLQALMDADRKCELMVYPKATHGTPFAAGNIAATLFMRLTTFFTQHLGARDLAPTNVLNVL